MGKMFMKDEYKPVRIMDFCGYDILFHKFLGIVISRDFQKEVISKEVIVSDESMVLYPGSIPVSLDSLKMWEFCEGKEDNGQMKPYRYSDNAKLDCSDAMINVSFSADIEEALYTKERFLAGTVLNSQSDSKKKKLLECFVDAYDINKTEYEKSVAEKRKRKGPRSELSHSIRERKNAYLKCIKKATKEKYGDIPDHFNNITWLQRAELYKNGFDVDTGCGTRHYVMYKRSASKAKSGSCLFIWDKIYEDMMDWTWMGLWSKFDKNKEYDLTSLKAYESLVSSSMIGKARIEPDQILLLDSVESPKIVSNRLILTQKDESTVLVTPEEFEKLGGEEYRSVNKIWDGQALVDKSVFDAAGYIWDETHDNRHGMMLLRNKFFKACAFNTNIQAYYKEKGVKTVTDMFGRELRAENIRMIVTLDSLKFVDKFADSFFEEKQGVTAKQQAYEHWLNDISSEFGIVKEEKASHLGHGKFHEISYQVLNTLPLSKEDMREIMQEDLRYLDLLKNDEAVLLNYMENVGHSVTKTCFFSKLYKYFSGFESTYEFREMRRDVINKYKNRMKLGRLKIRGDFYVLCSMPVEMLIYSADRDNEKIKSILGPGEAYIKGYGDKTPITICRYPHISSGSVCSLSNVNNEKTSMIDQYMNFDNKDGTNIVVISPWQSNIMVRLGGADFDSDSVIFIRDKVIERAAGDLTDKKKFGMLNPTIDGLPVVEVDDRLKGNKSMHKFNAYELACLDHFIAKSGRMVGVLSNDAQLFNAYFWEEYFKKDRDDEYLKTVYECSLILSALNELQIDSAKHSIGLDIEKEKRYVEEIKYKDEPVIRSVANEDGTRSAVTVENPFFLFKNKKKKSGGKRTNSISLRKESVYWNCPVDHIAEILNEKSINERDKRVDRISLNKLLDSVTNKEFKGKPTADQLKELYEYIKNTVYDLEQIKDYDDEEVTEREESRERIQSECLKVLKKKKISPATLLALYKRGYEKYSYDSKGNKTGKPHKKGDFKYPEVAQDARIRNRYLGFVLSIIEKMIPDVIKPDICRKNLTKEAGSLGSVQLWGEVYYYSIEHPEYVTYDHQYE
ncbi:MAG: hypothetical protein K6E33_01635 [Lachnospiraceae bacterium]|nr:hypothetical protein [Lachnospiraceae bacterium]